MKPRLKSRRNFHSLIWDLFHHFSLISNEELLLDGELSLILLFYLHVLCALNDVLSDLKSEPNEPNDREHVLVVVKETRGLETKIFPSFLWTRCEPTTLLDIHAMSLINPPPMAISVETSTEVEVWVHSSLVLQTPGAYGCHSGWREDLKRSLKVLIKPLLREEDRDERHA